MSAPADRDWRNNWRGPREPDAGSGEYEPATSGSPGAPADRDNPAEYWSAAADSLGREGMVTVWDDKGGYVGCLGRERWDAMLCGAPAAREQALRALDSIINLDYTPDDYETLRSFIESRPDTETDEWQYTEEPSTGKSVHVGPCAECEALRAKVEQLTEAIDTLRFSEGEDCWCAMRSTEHPWNHEKMCEQVRALLGASA